MVQAHDLRQTPLTPSRPIERHKQENDYRQEKCEMQKMVELMHKSHKN